jgi:MFS family permease
MRLKIYSFILFLNSFITGLIIPVLSLLLMDKGATLSTISLIMGFYAFTVIAFELPSGIMADLMGRKKTFCLSLIFSLLFSFIILFGRGFWVLCIALVINGLGRAISSGAFEALFIDSYINENGKDKLHLVTTRINVLDALGLSAGALIGGLFPEISKTYFSSLGVYDLNIIIKIIFTVLLIIMSLVYIKETLIIEKNKRITLNQHIKNSFKIVVDSKNIVLIFISVFSTGFLISSLETYWQPHLVSLINKDSLLILLGITAFLYFGAAMTGNIFSGKLLNKINAVKMYIFLRIILAFTVIIMALQTNVFSFIIFYSLLYLIFGMANIPEGVILNKETPNEARASILSIYSLTAQIGALCGSFINSVIINYISISKLWILGSIVIIITIMVISKKLSFNSENCIS